MSVIDDDGVKRPFTSIANVDYNGIVTSPFALKNSSNIFYSDVIIFNGRFGSTLHTIGTSNTRLLYPNAITNPPSSGCTIAIAGDFFVFPGYTTTQIPLNPTRGIVGIGTASVPAGYVMSIYGGKTYINNRLDVNDTISGKNFLYNGQDTDARYALASQGIGNLPTTGSGDFVRSSGPTISSPTISSPTISSPTISTPLVNNGLVLTTPSNGASIDIFTHDVNIQQNGIDSTYKQVNLNICCNPNGVAKSSFLKAVVANGWNGIDTIVSLQASGAANSGHNHSCKIVLDASYNRNVNNGNFGGTIEFRTQDPFGERIVASLGLISGNPMLMAENIYISKAYNTEFASQTSTISTANITTANIDYLISNSTSLNYYTNFAGTGMSGFFIELNKWWNKGYTNLTLAIRLQTLNKIEPSSPKTYTSYWTGRATLQPGVGVLGFNVDRYNIPGNEIYAIQLENVWDPWGTNYIKVSNESIYLANTYGFTHNTYEASYRAYG